MIYALVGLFVLLLVSYYTFSRSFISPISLLLLSFVFSLTIILLNIENWQVSINLRFIKYIITAVMAFAFGCLIAHIIAKNISLKRSEIQRVEVFNDSFIHARYDIFLFFAVPVFCTFIFLVLMYLQARNSGLEGNIFRVIYITSTENTSNFVVHQLREIVVAIAEISILEIMAIKYVKKSRVSKGFIIPIACYAVCALFSSDRNIFLRYIIFSLCVWVFFSSSMREKTIKKTNRQIFKKAAVYIVIAIVVFYLLGKVKSYTSNFERMIGLYGGSGLYNFNLYLGKVADAKLQYGKETFSQLIATLKVFGINVGSLQPDASELGMVVFTSPNGYVYASNIFSAMMPYVRDFGYAGIIIFPFVMGLFFEKLYKWAVKMRNPYSCGLYSMLVYAVVYFTMAEQFFNRFHLGIVYELGWFSIIYFIAFGRHRMNTLQ